MAKGHNVRIIEADVGIDADEQASVRNDYDYYTIVHDKLRLLAMVIMNHVEQLDCFQADAFKIQLALAESLENAHYHGNLERSSSHRRENRKVENLQDGRNTDRWERTVQVTIDTNCTAEHEPNMRECIETLTEEESDSGVESVIAECRIAIAQHLPPPDTVREIIMAVKDQGPGFDPGSVPDARDDEHIGESTGRGLLLIRSFMDEVRFNANATEITMIKRANPVTDADA